MRFVPHEYQRYCTEYIKTHPIAALFLDMGLGKTVITLSAIKDLMLETFEVSKVLIIAPLRVARDTWPAEIEKWDHLKGLDISVIVGDVKTRLAAVHHPAMIYIVNRENIRWLVEYYEKNGMRWDFSMVVIDELSSFKNYQSQRFKFLRKVKHLLNNQAAKKGQINNGNTLPKITRNASQKVTSGWNSTKGKRMGTAIAAPIFAINV